MSQSSPDPSSIPSPSKPSIGLVLVGSALVIIGALFAPGFAIMAFAFSEMSLPAIVAFLLSLQVIAGIGNLLHRAWGRSLCQGGAFGMVIVSGVYFLQALPENPSATPGLAGLVWVGTLFLMVCSALLNMKWAKRVLGPHAAPEGR